MNDAEILEQIRVYVETDDFWTEKNRRWVRGELRSVLDGDFANVKELL